MQGLDDPSRIVVIEVWDSIEAHRASAKLAPPATVQAVMQLVAGPPKGAYYRA